MNLLAGKSMVVTGAAGGIGLAIARAAALAGARVALLDNRAEAVAEAAATMPEQRGTAYVLDIRDRAAVREIIDEVAARQGIDCLVNNAAAFHYAPIEDMPEDVVTWLIDVGLKGTIWGIQAAIPHLKVSRGSILNLGSIATFVAIRNAAVYSAIKGAHDAMTRQLAGDLGAFGIRVNALAPGSVRTPSSEVLVDEDGWKRRVAMAPLRRLIKPEDVADAAVFLASDRASAITGVTLKIDAGLTTSGP